eukprot:ANDGO_03285.mRNA.1 hypothetical protein
MSFFANAKKATAAPVGSTTTSTATTTTTTMTAGGGAESVFSVQKGGGKPVSSGKRVSPALIRVQKDLVDLKTETPSYKVTFPSKDDLLHFNVVFRPVDGFYCGGAFSFTVAVPETYPHDPPKVHCVTTPIFHPNIDTEGNVCLNILRAEWKPVLSLQHVLFGLELLFAEPNPDDPLNKEAAELLRKDKNAFARQVQRTLRS